MIIEKGYDFDDVLLKPIASLITSRQYVDLGVNFWNSIDLKIPIIAAPMRGIISPELVIGLGKLGGLGILHRFYSDKRQLELDMLKIAEAEVPWGFSIGLGDLPTLLLGMQYGADLVCIDVANGYLSSVVEFTKNVTNFLIERNYYSMLVMSGNVATREGSGALLQAGAHLVRVGIGSGGLCTTRNNTGVGIPQITAIMDCSSYGSKMPHIVADGGIRNPGDAIKALAAGASAVMIGSLLGKTYESSHNGMIYGMASRKLQDEYYHSVKSVEGLEKELSKNISLEDFISDFIWNMKSAFTYLNARNITQLQKNATFIEVGKNSIKQL